MCFFVISMSGFVYSLKPNGDIHDPCRNPYLRYTSNGVLLIRFSQGNLVIKLGMSVVEMWLSICSVAAFSINFPMYGR